MVQNSIYVYVEIRVTGCTSILRSNQLFSPLYPISFSPLQCALFFMGTIVICWNRQGCLILLSAELPSLVWERIGGPCAYCLGLVVSILGPNNAAHVSLQVLYCLIEWQINESIRYLPDIIWNYQAWWSLHLRHYWLPLIIILSL